MIFSGFDEKDHLLSEPIEQPIRPHLKRDWQRFFQPQIKNLFYLSFSRIKDKDLFVICDPINQTFGSGRKREDGLCFRNRNDLEDFLLLFWIPENKF